MVAHFLTDASAAFSHRINDEPGTHVRPQFGLVNGRSVSFSGSVQSWARGNYSLKGNSPANPNTHPQSARM